VTRADNALAYVTPNFEGLYAIIAYTTSLVGQEAAGNNGDTRLFVLPQLNYVNGPLSLTLNYEHATAHNTPGNVKINVYDFGASYDFGVAKIMALFDKVKTSTDSGTPTSGVLGDETTWYVGGIVPITENDKVRAVYGQYKDKTLAADSCKKWGIGMEHYMSKRTNAYLDFASLSQTDKGQCTIYYNSYTASADAGAGGNTGGVGTRGVDVGLVHRF